MGFGKNLQFLRRMHNGMTQEALAEKMNVSRQTVSKWELVSTYPEMDKVIELCRFFSCSMDELIQEDMDVCDEAYSNIRVEEVAPFSYFQYAVISAEPEDDAINHVRQWAKDYGMEQPDIIGWDFPAVSQEQINVFHMHGYAAAWIIPDNVSPGSITLPGKGTEIMKQEKQKYAVITIKEPSKAPFYLIPNAYKTLLAYMKVNGLTAKGESEIISCFEREYVKEDKDYMDVYIAVK